MLVASRDIDKLLHPGFIDEEVFALYGPAFAHGIDAIALPWSGFLQLLPRLAFGIVRIVPFAALPFLLHIATIGLVAAFVSSNRLESAIPSNRRRFAAALGLAVLPLDARIYTTILDAHFFMALYLALLLLAARPTRRRVWVIDLFAAAFAALNGGEALLLAPLYVLTFRRHRGLSAVVLVASGLQLISFVLTGHEAGRDVTVSVTDVALSAVARIGIAPVGDAFGPLMGSISGWALLAVVIASGATVARVLPRSTVFVLGYLSVTTLGAGLLFAVPESLSQFGLGERYVVAATWTLFLLTVAAVPRRASVILAGLLLVGVVTNYPTSPETYRDVSCIGRTEPCTLNTDAGTVDWPGLP